MVRPVALLVDGQLLLSKISVSDLFIFTVFTNDLKLHCFLFFNFNHQIVYTVARKTVLQYITTSEWIILRLSSTEYKRGILLKPREIDKAIIFHPKLTSN